MIVDYKSRKNEVLASYETVEKLIADLREYAAKIELPDPAEHLGTLLSDIRSKAEKVKADRFNIMIAGESKSGKSTFINAYLGVELLPMDVKQCTSAIVEIKYGAAFSVKATYADGRQREITGDDEARDFLKANAALDDQYRDIPVPTINSEILVKSGLRARNKGATISISNAEVEAMLKSPEVQAANIYNLPDYNKRIKAYINARKDSWKDIVTKIEIVFPFSEDLRGIEIIDSPGVCARGGVAEITSKYIENADAIIFLKPVMNYLENEIKRNDITLALSHDSAHINSEYLTETILSMMVRGVYCTKHLPNDEFVSLLEKTLYSPSREKIVSIKSMLQSLYSKDTAKYAKNNVAALVRRTLKKNTDVAETVRQYFIDVSDEVVWCNHG